VRIGTWNLDGRWSADHLALIQSQECDIWLLTEVPADASLPRMKGHRTKHEMTPGKTWAAIFASLEVIPQPDPHPASAMVLLDDFRVVSSVLPWRGCGSSWEGATLEEKMSVTLSPLREVIDGKTVWGGDWNQALEGRDYVGTLGGRYEILDLVTSSELSVATAPLGSASRGHRSIDHIAVPINWDVAGVRRLGAAPEGTRLSDHDAYVVTVAR
jgi:hypothetical protein